MHFEAVPSERFRGEDPKPCLHKLHALRLLTTRSHTAFDKTQTALFLETQKRTKKRSLANLF